MDMEIGEATGQIAHEPAQPITSHVSTPRGASVGHGWDATHGRWPRSAPLRSVPSHGVGAMTRERARWRSASRTWRSLPFPARRAASDPRRFLWPSITRWQWETGGATLLPPASLPGLTASGDRGAGTPRQGTPGKVRSHMEVRDAAPHPSVAHRPGAHRLRPAVPSCGAGVAGRHLSAVSGLDPLQTGAAAAPAAREPGRAAGTPPPWPR
jgi:hypothetical protein